MRTAADDGISDIVAARQSVSSTGRVVFFGLFGIGNFGNDASLQAAVEATRRRSPQTPIEVICGDRIVVRDRFGLPATSMFPPGADRLRERGGLFRIASPVLERIPSRLWRVLVEPYGWLRALGTLKPNDHLIVPGTGILDDLGVSPADVPLALFRWCVVARLRRCRVSFLSVGAGPIHHKTSRWLMRRATGLAHYRSFRDSESRDYMGSLGIDTAGDPVVPDLVFGLRGVPRRDIAVEVGKQSVAVGLGVMNYRGWTGRAWNAEDIYRSYIERIVEFAEWLLDGGYKVQLIFGANPDRAAVRDVEESLGKEQRALVVLDSNTGSINSMHEMLSQIGAVDFVVASRFHNVIGAVMCARPVIAIGYEEKFDSLMRDLDLGDYCQRIENLDIERLKKQFVALVADRDSVHDRMLRRSSDYRRTLEDQYARVLRADTELSANCLS
jgi:polysaccharide pyruvyl transferase WcaK-like protein